MGVKQASKKILKTIRLKWIYGERITFSDKLFIHEKVNLDNVQFGNYCLVAHHAEISNASIGDRTSVGRYTKIQSADIGKFCSISWNVTIGATGHPINHLSTHAFSYRKLFGLSSEDKYIPKKKIIIGNDVWIGCDVVIMPGLTIGDGAVIGAGSIVTKDVAPYSVVVGNPAKKIRNRFSDEIIKELIQLQWWNLPDEKLKTNLDLFTMELSQETLMKIKRLKDKNYTRRIFNE